jgi:hypothetical protein
MTASKTLATSIRFTLTGVDMVALVAHLAGVSGINKQKFHAMLNRLINQELPQLVESPTIAKSPFDLVLVRDGGLCSCSFNRLPEFLNSRQSIHRI